MDYYIDHTKLHKVKHDYHKDMRQDTVIKIITNIDKCWLVEDINTLKRKWLMYYDIKPIE